MYLVDNKLFVADLKRAKSSSFFKFFVLSLSVGYTYYSSCWQRCYILGLAK